MKSDVELKLDIGPWLKELDALDDAVRTTVTSAAIRAGAKIVLVAMATNLQNRGLHPYATGANKDGADNRKTITKEDLEALVTELGVRIKKYSRGQYVIALVGPDPKKGEKWRIAHLVEFGHKASGWYHGPDVPPHPFVRPAVEQTRSAAEAKMQQVCEQEIEKIFKKA